MKIPYFGSMPKCVFVLSTEEFNKFLNGTLRSIEYSLSKQPIVGETVIIRPYDSPPDLSDNPFMDGKIVEITELPRKRGTMRRWLYTINVQLIMF